MTSIGWVRMTSCIAALAAASACDALSAQCASAQTGASSATYFAVASEPAAGGISSTGRFRMVAALGAGVVAGRATSPRHALTGGAQVAALRVTPSSAPWLTGARPQFTSDLNGRAAGVQLTLHGTAMDLGNATLKIGDAAARIERRTRSAITAALPRPPRPGWLPVEIATPFGTTRLERGIGVLPLLTRERGGLGGAPVGLRIRASRGDMYALAFGVRLAASPIRLPDYHHSLRIDPIGMIVTAVRTVTAVGGEEDLVFGPLPRVGVVHAQALVFGSSNPGYLPGSFTNVIRL